MDLDRCYYPPGFARQYAAVMATPDRREKLKTITAPTIVLHGTELAIGPASTDPNGSWGIHVQPPVDGRAQELQAQLELAARRKR